MLRIEEVNEDNFKDVPDFCRCCLYWQTSGSFSEEMVKTEMAQKKLEWLKKVTKEFGSCMKIAYLGDKPIGFGHYAPAKFFPKAKEYQSGPPSEDSVFLACLYIVNKESRGKGLGTIMLRNILAELKDKGIKAVETFARKSSENNPSGPLKLYLKHNFAIVNDRNDFPRVRLKL